MGGTHSAISDSKPMADMTNGFQHISPPSWDMASETFLASQPLAIRPLGTWEDTFC